MNREHDNRFFEVPIDELTDPELRLITGFFDRRANMVADVAAYHDLDSGELIISGVTPEGVSETDAKRALEEAIRAALHISPSDNLDMSA